MDYLKKTTPLFRINTQKSKRGNASVYTPSPMIFLQNDIYTQAMLSSPFQVTYLYPELIFVLRGSKRKRGFVLRDSKLDHEFENEEIR